MAAANNHQGRKLLLEMFDESSNTWKLIGGIKTREYTRDNPVEDATNAASSGNETESQYTGYSTVTINGSGIVDKRANAEVLAYKALARIAHSANPLATFRLSDPEETLEGVFHITSFGKSGDQTSLISYTLSLQSTSTVTYV